MPHSHLTRKYVKHSLSTDGEHMVSTSVCVSKSKAKRSSMEGVQGLRRLKG